MANACRVCGASFQPKNSRDIFCSDTCRKRSRRQAFMRWYCRKRGVEYLAERERKTCVICWHEFLPRMRTQKTCSSECARERNLRLTRICMKRHYDAKRNAEKATRDRQLARVKREMRLAGRETKSAVVPGQQVGVVFGLPLYECPRMKMRATSLPCGEKGFCEGCAAAPRGVKHAACC